MAVRLHSLSQLVFQADPAVQHVQTTHSGENSQKTIKLNSMQTESLRAPAHLFQVPIKKMLEIAKVPPTKIDAILKSQLSPMSLEEQYPATRKRPNLVCDLRKILKLSLMKKLITGLKEERSAFLTNESFVMTHKASWDENTLKMLQKMIADRVHSPLQEIPIPSSHFQDIYSLLISIAADVLEPRLGFSLEMIDQLKKLGKLTRLIVSNDSNIKDVAHVLKQLIVILVIHSFFAQSIL